MTTAIPAETARHLWRLRVRAVANRLHESLLFLPALMLVAAVVIDVVLGRIDEAHAHHPIPWTFNFTPGTASALLGIVAGATITTAGVVFSLLVVSLQLASGQFSPRVLRGFWRDRLGQVLVGLLLSTFVFCVLVLTRLDPNAKRAPALTVTFAMLLTLASVVCIIAYLNRISREQYVGSIVARIAGEALALVSELPYGRHIGMQFGDATPAEAPDAEGLGEGLVIRAGTDGWVQQISRRAVIASAPAGSVIRLETRVGAYLVRGTPLASIWPPPAQPASTSRLIREAVIVGPARTMQQDIDFGLRQLNDIALRALSPAVNDPTTAIEVVLRLGSILRPLMQTDLPAQAHRDAAKRVLLTPYDLDHAEYVGHAFDQVRIFAANHPQVLVAIARTLRMLRAACVLTGDRDQAIVAIDRQVELTLAGCAAEMLPHDRAKVEAAARS